MLAVKKIGKKSIPPDTFPSIKCEGLEINETSSLYCSRNKLYIVKKYSGEIFPVTGTNKYNKRIKKIPIAERRFPYFFRLTIKKNKAP